MPTAPATAAGLIDGSYVWANNGLATSLLLHADIRHQHVTAAPDGTQQLRLQWIVHQLATQTTDLAVDGAIINITAGARRQIQQTLAIERLIGMLQEYSQQSAFGSAELTRCRQRAAVVQWTW